MVYWLVCMVCKRFDKRGTLQFKFAAPAYLTRLMPGLTAADMQAGLDQCVSAGLLDENEAGTAWIIDGWKNYQIDSRTNGDGPKCAKSGEASTVNTVSARSTVRGDEIRGEETDNQETPIGVLSDTESDDTPNDVRLVFDYWAATLNKGERYKLTSGRRAKIRARLKDSTVEEIQQAIRGCACSAFHMGDNDGHKRHDDITLICRSREKLDEFIDRAEGPVMVRPAAPAPAPEPERLRPEIGPYVAKAYDWKAYRGKAATMFEAGEMKTSAYRAILAEMALQNEDQEVKEWAIEEMEA